MTQPWTVSTKFTWTDSKVGLNLNFIPDGCTWECRSNNIVLKIILQEGREAKTCWFSVFRLRQEGPVKLFFFYLLLDFWKPQRGLHSSPRHELRLARKITLEMWVCRESFWKPLRHGICSTGRCAGFCAAYIMVSIRLWLHLLLLLLRRLLLLLLPRWNCFVRRNSSLQTSGRQDTLAERRCGKEFLPAVHQQSCIYSLRGRTHPTRCQSCHSWPCGSLTGRTWLTALLLWRGRGPGESSWVVLWRDLPNKIYSRESSCP